MVTSYWFCPACEMRVHPHYRTSAGTHSIKAGGCGGLLEERHEDPRPPADAGDLVKVVIQEFHKAAFMPPKEHALWPLMQAVKALAKADENLDERLPSLEKGDKVTIDDQHLYRGKELTVIANHPEGGKLWLDDGGLGGALFAYGEISRIVPKEE